MEENTKNKQLINLDEDQLQAITGSTGGVLQHLIMCQKLMMSIGCCKSINGKLIKH